MKKKSNPKKVKISQRSEDRKDAQDRRYALESGRRIYEDWKQRLMAVPLRSDDLANKVNELGAELSQKVKHPEVLRAMLDIVDMKLADVYLAMKTGALHMRVNVVCPNTSRVNNVELTICNYQFDTLVSRANWGEGKVRIQCPTCGGLIHQKNMVPVVNKVGEN